MTVIHSQVFPLGYPLIRRIYLHDFGTGFAIAAPPASAWVRAGVSAAGGFKDDAPGWGGGAAFAFGGEACAPGDAFTAQVGDSQHSRPAANDALGDSWIKRANSSILVMADRGRHDGSPGLASNSIGAITRSGSAAGPSQGGASAGDDADPLALGFGGLGASTTRPAWYGGGGGRAAGSFAIPTFPAADGMVCFEFYSENPGYD